MACVAVVIAACADGGLPRGRGSDEGRSEDETARSTSSNSVTTSSRTVTSSTSSGSSTSVTSVSTSTTASGSAAGNPYTYEVLGSGRAALTYTSSGGVEESVVVDLPWSASPPDLPNEVTLAAQLQGEGEITCRILRAGGSVTTARSQGRNANVRCRSDHS
jgi:hypothetical protein